MSIDYYHWLGELSDKVKWYTENPLMTELTKAMHLAMVNDPQAFKHIVDIGEANVLR